MRLWISFTAVALSTTALMADNWPQWRGPSGTGVAAPGAYPTAFSDTANVAWKVALPSAAPSTPAVWDNHIFVAGTIDGQDGLLCLDRKGNERWRVRFGAAAKGKHRTASGSNSSPLTDGKRVFAYYKSGTIAALDFEGNVLWKKNLQEQYGKNTLWWDLGTSPVLAGGAVVIAVIQSDDSYLVALEASTGKEAWKEARHFTCPRESDQSYTTPSVITIEGRERIVVWGADHLTSHDAATGKTLWICDGFNPKQHGQWRSISSASVWGHVAVLSYGRGRNLCAIDLSDGLKSKARWLWNRHGTGADVPTPITHDGKAYVLEDGGKLLCIDIQTGKDIWTSKAARGQGRYFASPILANNNLYCVSERGTVIVGQPANGYHSVTTNSMNENIIASPVPVDNQLILRGARHLFCLGQ